ncbi:MAG: hypothetical protein M1823_005342 [Watsoniomyces obsoletus]|nr:MAG: hypothetical protein M1823_005342 [Watsoniomyces obsoletus]
MEVIRSTLQPILLRLPQPIHNWAITLLGPQCHETLLINVDLSSQECLKLATSKGLGIGIVLASSVVKVPQIIKLISSGSSTGVSFLSYLLETTSFVISLAYSARQGFPFSTYGETALIAVQNIVIGVLVLQLRGKNAAAATFVAGLAAAVYVLLFRGEEIVSMKMLQYFQAGAGVLGLASKAPQIWTVYKEGGTGQLSAFAVFNYLAGSLSRIFTTLQEVDDKLILYGFVAGFILNAVLAAQMVYYWNSPSKETGRGTTTSKKARGQIGSGGMLSSEEKAGEKPMTSSSTGRVKTPTTRRRG